MYIFIKTHDSDGNSITPQFVGMSEDRKTYVGDIYTVIEKGQKIRKSCIKAIFTKKTLSQIHNLQKQYGVSPADFDWSDIHNPTVAQTAIDAKQWKSKKRLMRNRIKKYALDNSVPARIEKVLMMNMWDELTEAEWRQLETIYDNYTGG